MGEELFGQIIFAFVGMALAALAGAVILRAAAKWVASIELPFGKAYTTTLIAYLLTLGVEFLVGFIVGFLSTTGISTDMDFSSPVIRTILIPANFLVQAGVVRWRLSVTCRKALLISLVMVAIGIAIGIICILIVLGITMIF